MDWKFLVKPKVDIPVAVAIILLNERYFGSEGVYIVCFIALLLSVARIMADN